MMRVAFAAQTVTSASIRAVNHDPVVDRLRGRAGNRARSLRTWFSSVGAGYAAVLPRVDCAAGDGVELLSQVDAFATEPSGRWVRGDLIRVLDDLRIRRGDVLVAGAGQIGISTLFGRSILADARLEGRIAAADVMILRGAGTGDDNILYAYALLCSSFGVRALRSCAYGTSIPRLRPDLIANLPIPQAEPGTVRRVAALVRVAMSEREAHAKSIADARAMIEHLADVREATEMCRARKARCVLWSEPLRSLCAWNTASLGGAMAYLRRRWSRRLVDAVPMDGMFYGLLRQRTPSASGNGVPLITQRDAQSVRQLPTWIADPGVDRKALFSPPNSIVVPGRGTLGEGEVFGVPILVTPGLSRYALTQDLLRIAPERDSVAVVHLFLSTLLGRRLIRSCAVGTKILQLRLDLLRELPIPELGATETKQVRSLHVQAVAAFDRASEAEDSAVRIIEEEVLPQWLA